MPQLYALQLRNAAEDNECYGEFLDQVGPDGLAARLPRGAVVAVRPGYSDALNDIAMAIEIAATRVVNAPVVLWPDCVGRRRAVRIAAAAWKFGARAIVWTKEPTVEQLRGQLSDPENWPDDVILWVKRRGLGLPPGALSLLKVLARHSPVNRSVTKIIGRQGIRLLNRTCPPGARPWHAALRATGIGLAMQREPTQTVAEMAFHCGFSSSSALSDRLFELIGARPSFIRRRLGGLWMLADAARRGGIMC